MSDIFDARVFKTEENMKNFILILALFISNLVASQVTINDGYIDSLDNFVELSVNKLDRKFIFTDEGNTDLVVCFIYDYPDSLPVSTLQWQIVKMVSDSEGKFYHVRNRDGRDFILSFMKDSHKVCILNVETNGFSVIRGETLDYSEI